MIGTGLRQSMAWIHTWLGLLAGWILFAMFLTGTASYFRPEITRWMQPEVSLRTVTATRAAETAIAHMQRTAPTDEQWFIYLPDERTPGTRIFSRAQPKPDTKTPARKEIRLDPMTGEPIRARETKGGEQFYRFHFQLQLPHPWGRWLAGLAAMFMLTAIISGVITHKRIFADFFTLRWRKGQRSWLDAHNAAAVLALPFHAMITYTGLITLVAMYMPWPTVANYQKPAAFLDEAYGSDGDAKAAGRPAALVPIAPLIAAATREWGGGAPARVIVRNPNDSAATILVSRSTTDRLEGRGPWILYSGADGRRLSTSPPTGAAIKTAGVMLGLHVGWFAGPLLRWIYALLGLTGTAMVGSGLVLWTAKRRESGAASKVGFRLVERINIGVIACLPAGMAAFLLANRLLPPDLAGRADTEVAAMFWVWFGLALLTLPLPARRAWTVTLGTAAAAFAAIPIVNALTTDRGLLSSIVRGDTLFVATDAVMLAVAAILALAAARTMRAPAPPRRSPVRSTPTERAVLKELSHA